MLGIAAGRLLAPYVGVSLPTYTGIIGAILAGIASGRGSAVGPRTRWDQRLLGPSFVLGGAAAIAAVPIVAALGGADLGEGSRDRDPRGRRLLLPAAILSAVGPMIVRATLTDVGTSGSIVGRLSAIGTAGAITGTSSPGSCCSGSCRRACSSSRSGRAGAGGARDTAALGGGGGGTRTGVLALAAVAMGGLALAGPSPCDTESAYYCIAVEVDPGDPDGRVLILDRLSHAYVDLPTRPTSCSATSAGSRTPSGHTWTGWGPIDVLHVGGGGFTFPRYLEATRPVASQTVLELDPRVLAVAQEQLGFAPSDAIR